MSGFSIDSVMDSVESEITSGNEESVDTEDRVQSIMDLDDEENDSEDLPDPTDEELNKNKEKTKTKLKDSDKDEEEESEEEDSDEEEEDESEEEEEKEEQKNGRLLKYKVDGKEVEKFYTDEELASAISAKEASLKRFSEIDKKSKEFEKKELEFNQKYDFVKKELSETRSGFDKTIRDFIENKKVTSNPLSSVYNLLDKMGLDAAQFDKAVLYHHIPIVAQFLDMSDEGRELFLTRHENEWHKKRQAANETEYKRVAEYEAKLKEENSKKRQAGLTDEDIETYSSELQSMGIKDVNLDKVIEWKALKPIYKRAEIISEKIGKKEDMFKIASLLSNFPDFTDEELLSNLGYKEVKKKQLDEKIKAKGKPSAHKEKKNQDIENDVDAMFREMFK